jgi:hypothetical protein
MRKLLTIAVLALLPLAAEAQFNFGLRLGYAPAMGDAMKDAKMSDGVKSQIPIQLDAMYAVAPDFSLGAYVSYGFGQLASGACDAGVSCSASDTRFGIQGLYSFSKVSTAFVPWVGAGIGYEVASYSMEADGEKLELDLSGWEFLNLQAGANYKVNDQFSFGPYVQLSVGQYSSADMTMSGVGSFSGDIPEKGVHQWFGFGVRGSFDL